MILLLVILVVFGIPTHASEPPCHAEIACALGDRSYHVKEPDQWDRQSQLPVLLHFHGWGRQGDLIVKHRRIAGATRRRGVLLVAPNGHGGSWDFWRSGSEDVAFARAVLQDVARRYPVDPDRIFVSGYSYGGAMAWRFVCDDGATVAALLSISGTIRQTENCATAPSEVRHVHGLNDTVMRFPVGETDTRIDAVELWRKKLNCGGARDAGSWQAVSFLNLERTAWTDCKQGQVTLDIHPGGHFIPHGWIARQLDELMGREPTYP